MNEKRKGAIKEEKQNEKFYRNIQYETKCFADVKKRY